MGVTSSSRLYCINNIFHRPCYFKNVYFELKIGLEIHRSVFNFIYKKKLNFVYKVLTHPTFNMDVKHRIPTVLFFLNISI